MTPARLVPVDVGTAGDSGARKPKVRLPPVRSWPSLTTGRAIGLGCGRPHVRRRRAVAGSGDLWGAIRSGAWRPPRRLPRTLSGGGLDAYEWLAAVCGAALEVVKCRTHPLEVPAEADIVRRRLSRSAAPTAPVTLAATAGPYYRLPVAAPLLSGRSDHRALELHVAGRRGWHWRRRVGRAAQGGRAVAAAAGQSRDRRIGRLLATHGGGDDRFAFLAIRKTIPLGARRAASAFVGCARRWRPSSLSSSSTKRSTFTTRPKSGGASVRTSIRAAMCSCAMVPPLRPITPLTPRRSDVRWESMPRENCRASGRVPRPPPLTATREVAELVERRWQEYGIAAKIN